MRQTCSELSTRRREFVGGIASLTALATAMVAFDSNAAENTLPYKLYCVANGSIDVCVADIVAKLFGEVGDAKTIDVKSPSSGGILITSYDPKDYRFRYTSKRDWLGLDYVTIVILKDGRQISVNICMDVNN